MRRGSTIWLRSLLSVGSRTVLVVAVAAVLVVVALPAGIVTVGKELPPIVRDRNDLAELPLPGRLN
jgi:hypothetical protein